MSASIVTMFRWGSLWILLHILWNLEKIFSRCILQKYVYRTLVNLTARITGLNISQAHKFLKKFFQQPLLNHIFSFLLQNMNVWLGGLLIPEACITATRQYVAQANSWSLEELSLQVHVTEAGQKVTLDDRSCGVSGMWPQRIGYLSNMYHWMDS